MIWVEITAGRHHGERGWYAENAPHQRGIGKGRVVVYFPTHLFPNDAVQKRLCDVRPLNEVEARIVQGLPPPERPRVPPTALPADLTWKQIDGFR